MNETKQSYVYGLRAVIEAIDSGRTIDKVLLRKDLSGDHVKELLDKAHAAEVMVRRVPVERIDRITRKNHQGVVALLSAVEYYRLEQIVPALYEQGDNPFVVVLDGVTDVRNFGAIARTCECAGANAIVIPERNSVSVNADAVKTSAGALNYLPVCREHSLKSALRYLRNCGYTVVGTSDSNASNYTTVDYTGPVALVMGAEDKGVSAEVMAECDHRVVIPEFGHITSLNVSVASGIIIYEVVRQRMNDGQKVN